MITMNKIIICMILIGVLVFSGCSSGTPEKQSSVSEASKQEAIVEDVEKSDVMETLKFPCDGKAGESFYLFTEYDGFDIIKTAKLSCKNDVDVLERKCIESEEFGYLGWKSKK